VLRCPGVCREQAQILRKEGMKRVLVLGSGYVSGPVVEYLTRDPGTQVTVGEARAHHYDSSLSFYIINQSMCVHLFIMHLDLLLVL